MDNSRYFKSGTHKKSLLPDTRGFTFPELLIATGIVVFIVTGISLVFNRTLNVYKISNDQTQMTQQAQAALEWMVRDIQSGKSLHDITGTGFLVVSDEDRYIEYAFDAGAHEITRTECDGISCSYIYDPSVGDPDNGVPAGTSFDDLPDDWTCPVCGIPKDDYVMTHGNHGSYVLADNVSGLSLSYYSLGNLPVDPAIINPDLVRTVEIDLTLQKNDRQLQMTTAARHENKNTPWYKVYGFGAASNAAYDIGVGVEQASDGGIVFGGFSYYSGRYDLSLFKINSSGTIEWGKRYVLGGYSCVVGSVVIRNHPDGGYVLATTIYSGSDYDIFLMRINDTGDPAWARRYVYRISDRYLSMEIANDGGIIIAGRSTDVSTRAVLIRTNKLGEISWAKEYWSEQTGVNSFVSSVAVRQAHDRGLMAAVQCNNCFGSAASGNSNILFIKTDENGNAQKARFFLSDSPNFGETVSRLVAVPGGYLLGGSVSNAGTSRLRGFLMRVNGDGLLSGPESFARAYYFNDSSLDVWFYGMRPTQDGGLIIKSTGQLMVRDFLLIKMEKTGEAEWVKKYSVVRDPTTYYTADPIEIINEGVVTGYFGLGTTTGLVTSYYDIVAIRTNVDGNLGCCYRNGSTVVSDLTSKFSYVDITAQMPAALDVLSDARFRETFIHSGTGHSPEMTSVVVNLGSITVQNSSFQEEICP